MTPTSEELEGFQDRLMRANSALGGSHNFVRVDQAAELAMLAREWLRLSSGIKDSADGSLLALDPFDVSMAEVFKSTKQRTRTSAFRKHIEVFKTSFMDSVVVPLMRHEGSPSQAAARQLEALFAGLLSREEGIYVAEAARCSAVKCHRAAIVMLWAAAIARFHADIQNMGFTAFNVAAAVASKKSGQPFARITKALNVTSVADLQLGRDFDVIAVGIELWKYDSQTFDELNRLLSIRNSASHPGSFEPNTLDVRLYAEKLRRYVFDVIGKTGAVTSVP